MIDPIPYKGFRLYQSWGPTVDVWQAFLPDGRAIALTTLEGCKQAVEDYVKRNPFSLSLESASLETNVPTL